MVTKLRDTSLAGKNIIIDSIALGATADDTLSKYNEGAWTPVIKCGGVDVTGVGSGTFGQFTQIGNVVFLQAQISFDRDGNTGVFTTEGLPVASASDNSSTISVSFEEDDVVGAYALLHDTDSALSYYVKPARSGDPRVLLSDTHIHDSSNKVNRSGFYFV